MYISIERGAFVRYLAWEMGVARAVRAMRDIRAGKYGRILFGTKDRELARLNWAAEYVHLDAEIVSEFCVAAPKLRENGSSPLWRRRLAIDVIAQRLAWANGVRFHARTPK